MAVRSIPRSWEFTCDGCVRVVAREAPDEHSCPLPDEWGEVTWSTTDAKRYVRVVLCPNCLEHERFALYGFTAGRVAGLQGVHGVTAAPMQEVKPAGWNDQNAFKLQKTAEWFNRQPALDPSFWNNQDQTNAAVTDAYWLKPDGTRTSLDPAMFRVQKPDGTEVEFRKTTTADDAIRHGWGKE